MVDVPQPGPPMDRQELQARAVKGALWTGIHTLVSLPLAFAVNVLVARVLGVEGYGRLTFLTTVITITSVIAGLGVTTALIQFGSKAHAAGQTSEVRHLLSGAQGFRLMVSGPVIAVAVLILVRLDWWLLAIALAFGVGTPALLSGARAALTIENRTDRAAQLTMVGNAMVQLSIIAAVLSVGTADAVWSGRVIVSGLTLALPLIAISPQYRRAVLRPSPPWRLRREFWSFAIPTGIAAVLGALVSNRTEVVILDWFSDEYAMGLFGLAFGLAGHVYAPAQAFVGPLVPAVSGLSQVDQASLRRAFLRTTRAGSSVGASLVVSLLPALALLVPLLYGDRFAPAADMLVLLGIASVVVLIGAPHMAFLMARLGGRRILWVNMVSLLINVSLAFALIPAFGAWGAVVACAGGMVMRALQITVGEARALSISPRRLLESVGSVMLAVVIALTLWLCVRGLELSPLVLAPATAGVGMTALMLMIRATRTGLTPSDVRAISSSLPRPLVLVGRAALTVLQGARDLG